MSVILSNRALKSGLNLEGDPNKQGCYWAGLTISHGTAIALKHMIFTLNNILYHYIVFNTMYNTITTGFNRVGQV